MEQVRCQDPQLSGRKRCRLVATCASVTPPESFRDAPSSRLATWLPELSDSFPIYHMGPRALCEALLLITHLFP